MRFVSLDGRTHAAGQIAPEDLPALAEGFTGIVNNRPDGEEPGQPSSAEIEAAAQAAGLSYRHVPVGAAGLTPDAIEAMREALAGDGKTLAFCRSGTRSTYLWALAEAKRGADPERLIAQAAAAGYDLAPLAGALRQLAERQ